MFLTKDTYATIPPKEVILFTMIPLDPKFPTTEEDYKLLIREWEHYACYYLLHFYPFSIDLFLPLFTFCGNAVFHDFKLSSYREGLEPIKINKCLPLLGHAGPDPIALPVAKTCGWPVQFGFRRTLPFIFHLNDIAVVEQGCLMGHTEETGWLKCQAWPDGSGQYHTFGLPVPSFSNLDPLAIHKLWELLRLKLFALREKWVGNQDLAALDWFLSSVPKLVEGKSQTFFLDSDREGVAFPNFNAAELQRLLLALEELSLDLASNVTPPPEWFFLHSTAEPERKRSRSKHLPGGDLECSEDSNTLKHYTLEQHPFHYTAWVENLLPDFPVEESWVRLEGQALLDYFNSPNLDGYSAAMFNALLRTAFRFIVLSHNVTDTSADGYLVNFQNLGFELSLQTVTAGSDSFLPIPSWQSFLYPTFSFRPSPALQLFAELRRTFYSFDRAKREMEEYMQTYHSGCAGRGDAFYLIFRYDQPLLSPYLALPFSFRGPEFQPSFIPISPSGFFHQLDLVHRVQNLEADNCLVTTVRCESALGLILAELDYLNLELSLLPAQWRSTVFALLQAAIFKNFRSKASFGKQRGKLGPTLGYTFDLIQASRKKLETFILKADHNLNATAVFTNNPGFIFSPSLFSSQLTAEQYAMVIRFLDAMLLKFEQCHAFGYHLQKDIIKFCFENPRFVFSVPEYQAPQWEIEESYRMDEIFELVHAVCQAPFGFRVESETYELFKRSHYRLGYGDDSNLNEEQKRYVQSLTIHALTTEFSDFDNYYQNELLVSLRRIRNFFYDVGCVCHPTLPEVLTAHPAVDVSNT